MRISDWSSDVCSSDLTGEHFAGHDPGVLPRALERGGRIGGVLAAELLQRRQRAVALAEALHAPTLLVDADQLRARRGLADRGRQLGHLRPGGEVALETDHARPGALLPPVPTSGIPLGPGHAPPDAGGCD